MLHDGGWPSRCCGSTSCGPAHTATFVHASNGVRSDWAMGWAQGPDAATDSALRAVIAAANRLAD